MSSETKVRGAIRLLLVDDYALVRLGIESLLESHDDIEIVAQAASVAEAVAALGIHPLDLALLDFQLPDGTGFDVLDEIVRNFPNVRTIIFSSNSDGVFIRTALARGAHAYVNKNMAHRLLVQTIRRVMS